MKFRDLWKIWRKIKGGSDLDTQANPCLLSINPQRKILSRESHANNNFDKFLLIFQI